MPDLLSIVVFASAHVRSVFSIDRTAPLQEKNKPHPGAEKQTAN
jgi:hypothetical protein